jgi:hypothetical protein
VKTGPFLRTLFDDMRLWHTSAKILAQILVKVKILAKIFVGANAPGSLKKRAVLAKNLIVFVKT